MSTIGSRLFTNLAVLVCLSVTGCQSNTGGDSARDDTAAEPSPAASAPTSSSDTTSTGSETAMNETDPVVFAETLWEAFYGNAALSKAQWWAQLKPLLSPAAAGVHKYTDPATFHPVTITGPVTEAPMPPDRPGVTSEVYVPTSEGRYSLFLIRSNETAPWRLEGIGFPEGAQK